MRVSDGTMADTALYAALRKHFGFSTFRPNQEQIVEAILAAVQRMYYPVEIDVPTGSIDVRQLRVALAKS